MKRMVHRYQISKFKRFTNGLLFAVITLIALYSCLTDITEPTKTNVEILLPFTIALFSLLLGFRAMFHNSGAEKNRI